MPKIIELARTNLIKSDINDNVQNLAKLMLNNNVGSVVVTKNDEILGFIDEKSILKLISRDINPLETGLGSLVKKFPLIDEGKEILDVWDEIKNSDYERWGIVNDYKKIIGIVRKRTINDFRVRILKETLHIHDELI